MNYTLNIRGQLLDLSEPRVMGILNVTPDSFYAGSRVTDEEQIVARARQIISERATFVDIGACSTRPGSMPPTEQQEMERLRMALRAVRRDVPEAIVSVDTFRPDVARMAVEEYGVDIINDVGAPANVQCSMFNVQRPTSNVQRPTFNVQCSMFNVQCSMFSVVSSLRVPYILMASQPTLRATLLWLAEKVQQLRALGQKDIIVDPGFGFGKTLEQNYQLMDQLDGLSVLDLPVLVGISRKSMIYKRLGCTPDEALNGTTALHAVALMKGASILRVHDVKAAVECCKLIRNV